MKLSLRILFRVSHTLALALGLCLSLMTSGANAQALTAYNNRQLSELSTNIPFAVTRLGFATAGDSDQITFFASSSACSLNNGAGDGGSQVPSRNGGCWIAHLPSSGIDIRDWGLTSGPVNFYVNSSTGSDTSNYCVLSADPCKTYLHAYQMAVQFDLQNGAKNSPSQYIAAQINLAAGAYQGFSMSGVLRGNSGIGVNGQYLATVGAGIGSTTITDSTDAHFVMDISNGMTAEFNDLTISVPAGEVGIFVENPGSYVLVNGGSNLAFSGASTTSIAMHTEGPSGIEIGTHSTFTFSGSFNYIFTAGDESRVEIDPGSPPATFACSSLTLGNSFAYVQTAEIDLSGIAFSGCSSVNGRPYTIVGNGYINNPNNVMLPFTKEGWLATGGRYSIADIPCIGGSDGCATTTAPTGAGSGATFAVAGHAGIHSGTVLITAGTGATSEGILYLQFASVLMSSDNTTVGACTVGLSRKQGAGTGWQYTGSAGINYQVNASAGEVLGIAWSNGGVNLAPGDVYALAWHCDAD